MLALPDSTLKLFERIKVLKPIEKFVLVGGTALALRIAHRYSEDLDFMTMSKLDHAAINFVLDALHQGSCKIVQLRNMEWMLDFPPGANPDDYSLRFRVDGVKLDFFSKQVHRGGRDFDVASKVVAEPVPEVDTGHIRVASENTIFSLKAQLLDERTTVRDFFDLRILLTRNRRGIRDLFREAESLGLPPDELKRKVIRSRPSEADPQINPFADAYLDVPTHFDSLKQWLVEEINELERDQAAEAMRSAYKA